MKRNLIETLMGAIVLAAALFFVVTTYQSSGIKKDYGYKLIANFDKVDGISAGSDVRLSGIKIGTVTAQGLNPDDYRAKITMGIQKDIRIPTDSTAEITSDGLLGGKYISLVPGAEVEMLKDGGLILYTQSSVNLEQLIGKMAFGGTGGDNSHPASAPKPEVKAAPIKNETIVTIAKPGEKVPDKSGINAKAVTAATPIETPTPNIQLKKPGA